MNSNTNNFVSAYQAYIEYFRQNFPFTSPSSYQEWCRTFFGENSERSLTNLSTNQNLENTYRANNNTYTANNTASDKEAISRE